jgi:hypothetical protein
MAAASERPSSVTAVVGGPGCPARFRGNASCNCVGRLLLHPRTIVADPVLLPNVHRAAYQQMLNDFITVANMLQPGPDYGTTAQD